MLIFTRVWRGGAPIFVKRRLAIQKTLTASGIAFSTPTTLDPFGPSFCFNSLVIGVFPARRVMRLFVRFHRPARVERGFMMVEVWGCAFVCCRPARVETDVSLFPDHAIFTFSRHGRYETLVLQRAVGEAVLEATPCAMRNSTGICDFAMAIGYPPFSDILTFTAMRDAIASNDRRHTIKHLTLPAF